MINKKQLKDLQEKIDAASAAIAALYQEIDDEGYEEKYNEATEKQQETDKYSLLAEVMEIREYEWADKLDSVSYSISNLLEESEEK